MPATPPISDDHEPVTGGGWSAELAKELAVERRRAREFAETHRRQVDRIEAQIAEHLQALDATLANEQDRAADDHALLMQRIQDLELERDRAIHQLAEAEANVARQPSGGDSTKLTDLRRSHEMALCDLRELRKRNADLESRLSDPQRSQGSSNAPLDWESQKRRILASLEAEGNEATPERQDELMTIDGTIRITDAVIVDKDHEIAELKKLLAEQSASSGAEEHQAMKELLDTDEVIRVERERLKQQQVQAQETLRLAEIELSQERAKMARERVELDEKRRTLEHEKAHCQNEIRAVPGKSQEKKSTRGRWLARLGLAEKEDE